MDSYFFKHIDRVLGKAYTYKKSPEIKLWRFFINYVKAIRLL